MTKLVQGPWAGRGCGSAPEAPKTAWASEAASKRVKGQPYRTPRHIPRPLTAEQRLCFQDMAAHGLTAIWVAGDLDGPQACWLGDNRGAWPVLMGLTQAWQDSKSATLIANEPYRTRAVMMRLWADTWDEADRVWSAVYQAMSHRLTKDTRGEWLSFEPDVELGDISAAMLEAAEQARPRIYLRTDDEILAEIDLTLDLARKEVARRKKGDGER